ncbi:MAG: MarR family transcriptional regulator [Novosphingobium sp.]
MPQAAFAYDATVGEMNAPLRLSLSIFADRLALHAEMREDAEAAGLRIAGVHEVAALIEGAAHPLGDVVVVDCPNVDGAELAALARLDLRAAHSGAQLIVSTSVAALDDVFACMDQSSPQLLVEPSRAERVIALAQAIAQASPSRVRELSDEDRLVVLRLTEQVGQIAQRLDRLAPTPTALGEHSQMFRFDDSSARAVKPSGFDEPPQRATPELPDPKVVRRIIRQRQLRGRFLDPELFADPAWDMLLDLTAATAERARVSVTSLCIAASVPPTTALRWIRQMTEGGLLRRIEDQSDRRRAFITLSDRSRAAMAAYFAELGRGPAAI